MAEGLLPPIILELRAHAGELKTELASTRKELSELEEHTAGATKGMSGSFTKAAGYGKTLTVGIAGAAVAIGGFALECATSAQVVDAKLRTAVENAGGSMEEMEPKVNKLDSSFRSLGFTNDQTNTALATMTTAVKDPEKALGMMGVAADLARTKNISLNDASLMVAKAMEGQTRPLKALGIDLPVYAGNAQAVKLAQLALANAQQKVTDILAKTPGAVNPASKAHMAYEKALRAVDLAHQKLSDTQASGGKILAELATRVDGAAAAYGDTLKGKIDAGKASVEAMGETLGKKLIPVVVGALGAAQKFVGWLGQHTPVLYAVAGVIGTVVVGAILAYVGSLVAAGVQSVIQFAKMAASAATWVAEQAAQLAESAAGFVVWAAEHAVMAGAFIASNLAMAASATAAFIAENAATLGIVAVIAVLIGAIVYAATHWKQVWGAISDAAKWAYSSVIKPVGDGIVNYVIHPIVAAVQWYLGVWVAAWHAVGAGASAIYNGVIRPIGSGISSVFHGIQSALSWLAGAWSSLWSGIGSALSSIYNNTIGPIVSAIRGAIGGVMGAIHGVSSAASAVGHFLGFANGGVIPGAPGEPRLVVAHGGEVVLSRDMLAGKQAPPPEMLAATTNAHGYTPAGPGQSATERALSGGSSPTPAAATTGGGTVVNVYAQTNASAARIGGELGWVLRKSA